MVLGAARASLHAPGLNKITAAPRPLVNWQDGYTHAALGLAGHNAWRAEAAFKGIAAVVTLLGS